MPETAVRVLLVGEARSGYLAVARALAAIRTRPHNLRWCNRFAQALPRLLSADFDIILVDAQSDRDTALRLLATAADNQCESPIILISDDIDADFDEAEVPRGAVDCLSRNGALDAHMLGRSLRYATERRQAEQALTRQAQHDALTGLPNRLLFRDRLQHALERARRLHTPLALLHLNFDGFRRINESFGHAVGDALLRVAARRLEACVRKTDTLARIGGDEFAIVLEDARCLAGVTAVIEKIMEAAAQPFLLADTIDEAALPLTLSLGIALYPDAGGDIDVLIRHADQAMQQAKRVSGNYHHFYSEQLQLEVDEQLHLEADLRRALRRNEFELFYQPRVELESGDIVGVEALIRWRHPERGLLSPVDFIPFAEEVGLIVPIGYWVIQRACRDLQFLSGRGHTRLDLAINLSCRQFQDEKFVETVTHLLQQSGLDLARIEFELTETAIMLNTEQIYTSMQSLSRLGVSFSLDDFGTGYSSFAHIQRLPISALKIDRGFVRRLPSNGDDATIVRAMINLARSLKLSVVAEGAESLEQVHFLWENLCHQVQGYYFSPAVAMDHLLEILEQRAVANF
ncbi:MAG: EAL domain-containing protein [Spongiibacteraceae bacterium]